MVTYEKDQNTHKYDFEGLSTDTKPDLTDYPDLTNGSTFMEMDTKKLYYWDAAGSTWV